MGAVERVSHRLTRSTRRKRAGELVERAAIERAAEAVGYILKQMSPQACWKRGLTRRKGGPIVGKRGGVSRKIDRRAQGSDQGRYPPAKDRMRGGWPRGGARPRGVSQISTFGGGTLV
jgi:hypothetical protein